MYRSALKTGDITSGIDIPISGNTDNDATATPMYVYMYEQHIHTFVECIKDEMMRVVHKQSGA